MGGKVLMLASEKSEKKGEIKGRKKGMEEKGIIVYNNARDRGMSIEDAQAIAEISDKLVAQIEASRK